MSITLFKTFSAVVAILGAAGPSAALVRPDGVGRLPALGWNSWNAFNCDIDESKFLTAAEKLISLGLKVCNPVLLWKRTHAERRTGRRVRVR